MSTFDPMLDHRARLERDQFEAAERRGRTLVDQSSPQNSPAARINAWERLHDLRLPKDPAHAILAHVAEQTALPLADVLEVQRLRAQPATDAG
jgi:hypothetical protein